MLEIKKIRKVYETGDLKQVALNNVSINFRKNEFVSILGPSGSGKTTLLNAIGGLDTYDSGDLIINGVSTKDFSDHDWDNYRNHRIGFVFQSYNLIPHQSILKNVELALALSGVNKSERTSRAKKALTSVGLGDHINKKPTELSGGQMQRVAIARALVNNPEILLADEPTGALDSKTSEQIMKLLESVSKDRLVIMVTHNPDLAERFFTRIITLKDGVLENDSNPYSEAAEKSEQSESPKKEKSSMSLLTALSLSFNNLTTKLGRTLLTAFAGSIGIIGIALILSLANGISNYVDQLQRGSMSSSPVVVEETTVDSSDDSSFELPKNIDCPSDKICLKDDVTTTASLQRLTHSKENNTEKLKTALDNNYENIKDYTTSIEYQYGLTLNIYSPDTTDGIIQVNPSPINAGADLSDLTSLFTGTATSSDLFQKLSDDNDSLLQLYDVISGHLPNNKNEAILVVDQDNKLPASAAYALNYENRDELSNYLSARQRGEDIKLDLANFSYDSLLGASYRVIPNTSLYKKQNDIWQNFSSDPDYMRSLIKTGENLTIVGIMKAKGGLVSANSGFVGYRSALAESIIKTNNSTSIAQEQIANKDTDILTGTPFDGTDSSYKKNLQILGVANLDAPSTINIYPKNYDAKEQVLAILDKYNDTQSSDSDKIIYNDTVGTLMSAAKSVVNVISVILVALVAISLIVSSIMISIITYISVLERTKEIGILRAIGASKKDITRVFNAENLIEGLVAGVIGIAVTASIDAGVSVILADQYKIDNLLSLPLGGSTILLLISIFLTILAGAIPSKMASHKNPVESLRSE